MPISKASGQAVAPAAKGDLVVGSATNDAAVLGVGTDGQYLTAASTTTTGLQWAAATDSTKIPLSTVTTNGDLIYGTGANTVTRLGIGSSGQYLTVSGGVPAWGSISAGGVTLISTTSTGTGTSVTVSSIPQTYKYIYAILDDIRFTGSDQLQITANGNIGVSAGTVFAFFDNQSTAITNGTGTAVSIGAQSTANHFMQGFIMFPNYADTTSNSKFFNFSTSSINTISAQNGTHRQGIGGFVSTSSNSFTGITQITSLRFSLPSFNFTSGSILLYGVN